MLEDLSRTEIVDWLMESDDSILEELWRSADATRRIHVGDEVHLRGLIEISNYCTRRCAYCGIRFGNRVIERYRMTVDEILACAANAAEFGYGTVVLQAGEDPGLSTEFISSLIKSIKTDTGLAVTLSLGERKPGDLEAWKEAGADRYLLRFETANPQLYAAIHPGRDGRPGNVEDRLSLLKILKDLNYEVGSGIMIGIPGQSYESVADDLLLFRELDLDMIGVGPYIPHPETPIGSFIQNSQIQDISEVDNGVTGVDNDYTYLPLSPDKQVSPTEQMTYKVVALTRLVCPEANIPSTTALATLNTDFARELGLRRGANVVMPNLTPARYRKLYEIYPAKACVSETADACNICLTGRIKSIGRRIGSGAGGRRREG